MKTELSMYLAAWLYVDACVLAVIIIATLIR